LPRGEQLGPGRTQGQELLGRGLERPRALDMDRLSGAMASPSGLTARGPTFGRPDGPQALARRIDPDAAGTGSAEEALRTVSVAQIERLATAFLGLREVVAGERRR